MDNEILELLKDMQNDMKFMKSGMKSMQGDIKSMQGDIKSMQGDIKSMQGDINSMQGDIKVLDKKVDKNTLLIENLSAKTETIAEVLNNHDIVNQKQHIEIQVPIKEKLDVVELAVKDISKDMKDLNMKFDKVEKVTMQNTYDVAYLKLAK